MSFIWPPMLLAVGLVPIGVLLYWALDRRRHRRLATRGGLGLGQGTTHRPTGLRSRIPAALIIAGMAVITVAMARPQAVIDLPRVEGTVILAFDVSASMGATDLVPTRMDAAKAAAKDFVARQPDGISIGVVAFSDSGVSVQAATNDQATVIAAIDRLTPERGTSVAQGIIASLNAIAVAEAGPFAGNYYSNQSPVPTATPTPTPVPSGTHAPAVIVLLSDGNNNETPDPLAAAKAAADRGVRIYTVGIGSASGTDLHIGGFIMHTQLDDTALRQVAALSNGAYYSADNAQDLLKIYQNINTQLVIKPEDTEVTSVFAGAGIFFLLVGAAFSLLWFGRMP